MTPSGPLSAASEKELIERAASAVSSCNWEVGACAAAWTKRFSKGRTDADFANLVGLSSDQIFQRRRVWETFGDVYSQYPQLKWSHFYTALTWDDAAECLQWANDLESTVAEMKAWRRAQRGEDLSEPADEDPYSWLPMDTAEMRMPRDGAAGEPGEERDGSGREREPAALVASGVARESAQTGDDYAPFRPDAVKVPGAAPASDRTPPTIEQLVRRLASTLERCAAMIDDDFAGKFADIPGKDRQRVFQALQRLSDKLAELE